MLRLKESTSKAGYLRLAMDGNATADSAVASSSSGGGGGETAPVAPAESEEVAPEVVVAPAAVSATSTAPAAAASTTTLSAHLPPQGHPSSTANSFLLAPQSAAAISSSSGDPFPRGESAFELSRQPSKSPLARVTSETSAVEDKSLRPKMDFKPTPRRVPRNGKVGGGGGPAESDVRGAGAPCEQHSFLTDVTDVRQMEQGLLQLLHDFHSGKLQAFGKDCTFEKMEHVREQQERLARLHFELNAQQELCGPESEEGRQLAKDNLTKLIENLQHLSQSIEQLQSHTQGVQTDV